MIGRVKSLLYQPNLGGFVSEVVVNIDDAPGAPPITWLTTSIVKSESGLEKNASLLVNEYVYPLLDSMGLARPNFRIGFENTPYFAFRESIQPVGDTSAGLALLVAMISSCLRIPVNGCIAMTGAISPPSPRVLLVRGYEDKVAAAFTQSDVQAVLLPSPKTIAEGTSEETVESRKYSQWLKSLYLRSGRYRLLSTIDDIWPYVFPGIEMLEVILAHPFLYEALRKVEDMKPPVAGLIRYLSSLYEDRWRLLNVAVETADENRTRSLIDSMVSFYSSKALDPDDLFLNIKKILEKDQLRKVHGLFTPQHWALLSRLYSLPQYGDLIRLLLLTGESAGKRGMAATITPLWSDTLFRESLREMIITAADEKDFSSLRQILQVLIRMYTAEEIMPDIREDLLAILTKRFFDDWTEVYGKCCEEADRLVLDPGVPFQNPSELQQQYFSVFRPFQQRLANGISMLESLFMIDPLLTLKLRQHSSFLRVSSVIQEAKQTLESNLSTGDQKMRARLDWDLFHYYYSRLRAFDDLIANRLSVQDNQVILEPDLPTMVVEVSQDLSKLGFSILSPAQHKIPRHVIQIHNMGNEINDPVLLWQESVNLPEYWKSETWSRDADEILAMPDGHVVAQQGHRTPGIIPHLFSSSFIDICFLNTSIICAIPYRWPPSIDSLFFMKTLKDHGYFERTFRNLADIGSGTGFLGICLVKNNRGIRSLYSVDISAGLKLLTEYNIRRNLSERLSLGLTTMAVTGSGLEAVASFAPFDLVICTPPYLPEREIYQTTVNLESPVDGTDLLESVIISGRELAKEIVIEFSEIALPEFEKALKSAGASATMLGSKLVPIRIPPIAPYAPDENRNLVQGTAEYYEALTSYQRRRAYTDMLVQKRGLRVLNLRNFKYWQEIRVYSVRYQ